MRGRLNELWKYPSFMLVLLPISSAMTRVSRREKAIGHQTLFRDALVTVPFLLLLLFLFVLLFYLPRRTDSFSWQSRLPEKSIRCAWRPITSPILPLDIYPTIFSSFQITTGFLWSLETYETPRSEVPLRQYTLHEFKTENAIHMIFTFLNDTFSWELELILTFNYI